MTLFALLGLPAFLTVVFALRSALPAGRSRSAVPAAVAPIPLVEYLKGLVYGVVGAIVGAVLQKILPFSYRPFPMFLYYFVVDYLVVAGLATTAVVLFYSSRTLLETIFFVGGFYSVVAVGSVLTSFGAYEPYSLFLRPAAYLATTAYLPVFLAAFRRWNGLPRALYAAAVGVLPFVSAAVALLQRSFYEAPAAAAAAVFLAGAVAAVYYSGER